jgi:hypothetical protein
LGVLVGVAVGVGVGVPVSLGDALADATPTVRRGGVAEAGVAGVATVHV